MPDCHRRIAGFTLIELLIVVAVIGILVGLVMPSTAPALHEQLRSVARIVATDLAYARSLAVTNNSEYRVTFYMDDDADKPNTYIMRHIGIDTALDTLEESPFRSPGDPDDQHIVVLDELPRLGPPVRIVAARVGSTPVTGVKYKSLGETGWANETVIWLAIGQAGDTRYLPITVNPVTGLAEVGEISVTGPPEI